MLLYHLIVAEGYPLREGKLTCLDLAIAALVDELADALEIGVAVCDEGLDNLQHLEGSFCKLDEDARINMQEAKKLEGFAFLRVNLVDTLDADYEDELRLSIDVIVAFRFGKAAKADLFALGITIFLDVRFGTLKDNFALFFVGLEPECK